MPETSKTNDVKDGGMTSSSSSAASTPTPKDSPAFRLRPRRTTPRASTLGSIPGAGTPGRKASALFAKNSPFFESTVKFEPQSFETVKRKLLQYLKGSNEDSNDSNESKKKKVDEEVVKDGINMGIFLPRIRAVDLRPNQSYPNNYVSLNVVTIVKKVDKNGGVQCEPLPVFSDTHNNGKDSLGRQDDEDSNGKQCRNHDKKEHKDQRNHHSHSQVLRGERNDVSCQSQPSMILMARDAGDGDSGILRVYVYGQYADKMSSRLEEGNVIEVTKFSTLPSSSCQSALPPPLSTVSNGGVKSSSPSRSVKGTSCDRHHPPVNNILPVTIIISSKNESLALNVSLPTPSSQSALIDSTLTPLVSIKKKYESIDNPLLLKVNMMVRRNETPSPGLRFSSKCLRPEDIVKREMETSESPTTSTTEPPAEVLLPPTSTTKKQAQSSRMTRRSCSMSATNKTKSCPGTETTSPTPSRCSTRRSHSQSSATPPMV